MKSPHLELKKFRLKEQITVREMADRLSCTHPTVVNIEAGRRRPGRDLAIEIERVVGIDPSAWNSSSSHKQSSKER